MPVTRQSARAQASSAEQTQEQKDTQLLVTWQRYSKLLTASGHIDLSQEHPLNIFYIPAQTEGAGGLSPGLISFPLTSSASSSSSAEPAAALQQLVSAAAPSPFGKGQETVYDSAVRTAAEIKASQLALNRTLPSPEILEEVRLLLQPNASSVVAEPDKLNIYGPGGFFKPHFDTPRSEDHFGTLIICLPTPFKGGQLVLRHIDHNSSTTPPTKTYDWAAMAGSGSQALHWAAFYADTEHEVLPMSEGHRLTLTYNLRAMQQRPGVTEAAANDAHAFAEQRAVTDQHRAQQSSSTRSRHASSCSSRGGVSDGNWLTPADVLASVELTEELTRLLGDSTWHPLGDRLGFILQHKYCHSLRGLTSLPFPQSLKGPDRVLAAALQQAGFNVRVVPVFRGYTGSESEEMYQDFVQDMQEEDDGEGGDRAPAGYEAEPEINWGRPLQPAQQRANLTTEPGAYWALLVGSFETCAQAVDASYRENEDNALWTPDTAQSVGEALGAEEEDICWATPVLDEHFTYFTSVLAGANCAFELCYHSTAAIIVDVPCWGAARQALAASNTA